MSCQRGMAKQIISAAEKTAKRLAWSESVCSEVSNIFNRALGSVSSCPAKLPFCLSVSGQRIIQNHQPRNARKMRRKKTQNGENPAIKDCGRAGDRGWQRQSREPFGGDPTSQRRRRSRDEGGRPL